MKRTSAPSARARSSARLRAVAGDHERQPGGARRVDRVREALLGREPARGEHVRRPRRRASASAISRCTEPITCARSPTRRAQLAQPAERERARDDERVDLLGEPALPERQAGRVGGRLGARAAAAVQPQPGQRVAPVAARAVLPAREAQPLRAHEPVVVQVQHDARARLARRRQRAPAERRVDVVGVDHPRAGAPHRVRDLLRARARRAAARRRGAPVAEHGRVALEHLRVLAEVLADQPREVLDGPLLAAGQAVAVVQQQDHGAARA